jgi:hypothetical protein
LHLRERVQTMGSPTAGISEADWLSWPSGARELILAQQEEFKQLRTQLTALGSELASLRERDVDPRN